MPIDNFINRCFSQINTITGKLIDRDTKEGVMMVTVQMLTQDSTYISGVLSDEMVNLS